MHRVCSVQNGRRTLLSRRACFYADEIYARASADRRTDRVSLPLCFNSLVAIFPLALSLFASSLQSSVGLEPSLSYPPSYTIPSLFLCLPFSLVYFCSFACSPSVLFPLSSINLPSFSLSLAPRYPTPTPLSLSFIFRFSASPFPFSSSFPDGAATIFTLLVLSAYPLLSRRKLSFFLLRSAFSIE